LSSNHRRAGVIQLSLIPFNQKLSPARITASGLLLRYPVYSWNEIGGKKVSIRSDFLLICRTSAVKAERGATVMDDQDGLAQVHGVEPGVEVARMIDER
jgi:hypothetical protein